MRQQPDWGESIYRHWVSPNIERFFEVQFADTLICHFVYGLIKISVVVFYKRIFTSRHFNICANIVLGMISLYIILSFFVSVDDASGGMNEVMTCYLAFPLLRQSRCILLEYTARAYRYPIHSRCAESGDCLCCCGYLPWPCSFESSLPRHQGSAHGYG